MSKSISEGKTCNYKFFEISLVANMALQFRNLFKTRTGEASALLKPLQGRIDA